GGRIAETGAWSPGGGGASRCTRTSGGSSRASRRDAAAPAASQRFAGMAAWAAWPPAGTPASVRAAPGSGAGYGRVSPRASASSRVCSTVRRPGWRAQPEKPVPSYPMSSLTRISAERRVPGPPGPASSTPAPAPWALLSVLLGRIPVRRVRLGRVVFGGGVLGGAVLGSRVLGHRAVGRRFFCHRVLGRSLLGHLVLSRCFLGQGVLGHRVLSLFDRSFLGGSVLSGHVSSRDVLGCGAIGTGVRGLPCRRGRRCGLRPGRTGRGAADTAPPRRGRGGLFLNQLDDGERRVVTLARPDLGDPGVTALTAGEPRADLGEQRMHDAPIRDHREHL